MKSSRVWLASAIGLLACGPAPAPERPTPPPLAIAPLTPAQVPAPPKPDPNPRAPENLALLVRVNDPEQLARQLVAFLPPSVAATFATLDAAQLVTLLLGRKLGSKVDLTQTIDVASLGGGDTSFVVSFAVKQDAEAKLGEGLVLREEGGLIHIAKPDEATMDGGRMSACAFTSGTGRVTTRLLCASDDAALEAAAAYLARTVAAEVFDADARITLPGKLLREKRGSTARAIKDAASARLGNALVDRFTAEIDRIDADLRLGSSRLELDVDLRLTARESIASKLVVMRSAPADPPRAFYRLPADSLVALHTTGALAEDITPLRSALADDLERSLLEDGYAAAKVRDLRDRISALVLTGGPLVLGAGVVGGREGAEKTLAAVDGATAKADEARTIPLARAALVPWVLVEVEEAPERWTQGLRDIVQRGLDAERTRTAPAATATPHDPNADHIDVRVATLDPALKLPRGSLHLEVLVSPRTKGTRPARTEHLFVVPKGAATWIGYCENAGAIASRLRLALDDATEAGTLAKSADATALRGRPAIGAGLVSMVGIALLEAKTITAEDVRAVAKRAAQIAALGLRGPEMVAWSASSDAQPGSIRASFRVEATRATAVDILKLLNL